MQPDLKPPVPFDGNGRVKLRITAGEGEALLRCVHCEKLLGKSHGFNGRIDLFCRRCKRWSVFHDDQPYKNLSLDVTTATSRARLDALGFGEETRPGLEEIAAVMEARWQIHMKRRAKRSVDVAVGLRFDVLLRDGFCCRYCGVSVEEGAMLHVDHVIPQSKGGPTVLDNLVTACLDCNIGKSDKTLNL